MQPDATRLIGTKPRGDVRQVSLAVKHYLDTHRPPGLVLGVSGGADSLALATAAIDLAGRQRLPLLSVIVDHGIRDESAAESRQVAALLKRLGAKNVVVARPACVVSDQGPEGSARQRRHTELQQQLSAFATRKGLAGADLLLGHTLDDQAETVLLRLARGAGLRSLAGMPNRRQLPGTGLWIGRPLLRIRRAQTEGFCKTLGLPVVHDPTNRADSWWRTAGGDPLRRAAVRDWALPELSRALGQDPAPALARTADQLREDNEALDHYAKEWLSEKAHREGEIGPARARRVDVSQAKATPAAVRRRIWRILALECGALAGQLSDRQLRAVDELAVDWRGKGPVQLPGHVVVRRAGDSLVFAAK